MISIFKHPFAVGNWYLLLVPVDWSKKKGKEKELTPHITRPLITK
jgi:hypothetical protein